MSKENSEPRSGFEQRLKRVFDDGVASLDGQTRSKLARARNRALRRASRPSATVWLFGPRALVPVGAAAAFALAWFVWQSPVSIEAGLQTAELNDWEILLGEDELEMIEELEFYVWLEEYLDVPVEETDGGIG